MELNYVYNAPEVQHRQDLVADCPTQAAIPACLEACAQYVPTITDLDDVNQAKGPASSTREAELESDVVAEDAQELSKWLSVVEDRHDDVSELTSIPSLQGAIV